MLNFCFWTLPKLLPQSTSQFQHYTCYVPPRDVRPCSAAMSRATQEIAVGQKVRVAVSHLIPRFEKLFSAQ